VESQRIGGGKREVMMRRSRAGTGVRKRAEEDVRRCRWMSKRVWK
jgi:hypothetical protein